MRSEIRWFPILRDEHGVGGKIPWELAEAIHKHLYEALYPNTQTLERLAERGGFAWSEVRYMASELLKGEAGKP